MPLRSKDLKAPAWSAMRAAVPSAVLVTLVYYLLIGVLPDVVTYLAPTVTVDDLIYGRGAGIWIALFLSVLLTLFQMVMEFGYQCWALHTARGQRSGFGDMLDGFGMVGRVLLMKVQVLLRTLCWFMGIAVVYTIILYSIIDLFFYRSETVLLAVFAFISVVFLYIAIDVIMLRYDLAPFLLCDYPDAGSAAAVRRSVEMTRGHRWELCKLYLSFWPWYLASFLISLLVSVIALVPSAGELSALFFSGSFDVAVSQIQLGLSGALATFLSLLLSIPLDLFFLPYRRISVANFYRALSLENVAPGFSGETF